MESVRISAHRGALPSVHKTEILRLKALRVAKILEEFQGTPRQRKSLPPPIDMLIATILSQNTNDRNSHNAYLRLRSAFPSWKAVALAPRRKVVTAIRVGGMANQKAARIQAILRELKKQNGSYALNGIERKSTGTIMGELTRLKGVGPKTAACVLLFSLGRDVFPVDTHVHRTCVRLGLAAGSRSPERTFEIMRGIVPKGRGYSFHTNLIRFGRTICRAANPLCGECPLYDECVYEGKKARAARRRALTGTDHKFMLLDNV